MDLNQLAQQISDLADTQSADNDARDALVKACTKLLGTWTSPMDKLLNMLFTIYDPIVIRIACDLNLVDIALAHDGSITAAELAEKSKADAELIQTGNTYSLAPFGHLFATGSPVKECIIHITHIYPAIAITPEYLSTRGYKNPTDAVDGPFQLAYGIKGVNYFEYMAKPENKRYADAFNATMSMHTIRENEKWGYTYPIEERLKVEDPERVLLVDVGGGLGHQTKRFKEQHPSLVGKLIVEDLPEVVERAVDLPPSITTLAHSFFDPQPETVKNAKAYYLRSILHDWPQEQAHKILCGLRDVMADDSVLLLDEIVLPESGVSHFEARMDWHMMCGLSSLERSELQWRTLLDGAGLRVVALWADKGGKAWRHIIECAKKS